MAAKTIEPMNKCAKQKIEIKLAIKSSLCETSVWHLTVEAKETDAAVRREWSTNIHSRIF